MEEEEIFELMDSIWYEHEIFTKKPTSTPHKTNPVLEIKHEVREPKVSSLPSLHACRPLSDHSLNACSTTTTSFFSPDDHPLTPKLQTILSGKEFIKFTGEYFKQGQEKVKPKMISSSTERRKKKNSSSKSLSDLEFEELKGFMDLGFVFSGEDIRSSLVSIIPGLQRLKGTKNGDNNIHEEAFAVSRPYLSEAWDVLDKRKVENSLMNWRIPSQLGNEVDMKDHLRFWAHTVAATVR